MKLGRRTEYCPVCEKDTRHKYETANPFILVLLLCMGIVPGLLYLLLASGKSKRTSECMNDHAKVRAERRREEMAALAEAMRASKAA